MSWLTDFGKNHLQGELQNRAFMALNDMAHKHPMRILALGLLSGYLASRIRRQTPRVKLT